MKDELKKEMQRNSEKANLDLQKLAENYTQYFHWVAEDVFKRLYKNKLIESYLKDIDGGTSHEDYLYWEIEYTLKSKIRSKSTCEIKNAQSVWETEVRWEFINQLKNYKGQ